MATMKENTRTHLIILIGLVFLLLALSSPPIHAMNHYHNFVVADTPYTRLCSNKSILTVNGQFPGPTAYVYEGDTIFINVTNRARENITIHWHGVKQLRYPWSDGPEYITQCPIRPGEVFNQKIVLSDEIGTLWWHAHSDWSRATVHGALVVKPKIKNDYPFPKPDQEVPIILGEWWKSNIQDVLSEFLQNGGDPNVSDAFLINGQPGDLYPCSRQDTFKLTVDHGKRYLLRMVNAVMNNIMFVRFANHTVTIVGSDGAYTKPFRTNYVAISPGQTIDLLLEADQPPSRYYMAARVYNAAGTYDNTTTTAIIQYTGNYTAPPPANLSVPSFPEFNDTAASNNFTRRLRFQAYKNHKIDVPLNPNTKLYFTLSINTRPCPNDGCAGPLGQRLLASMNNITFQQPTRVSILQAYYDRIRNVYGVDFPRRPPFRFNYTAAFIPRDLWVPTNGTEVRVLRYGDVVELVFQGTNTVAGIDHPMHLHGHSFYVVGSGFGNFNQSRDPSGYNLVDPPLANTIAVPRNGWTAIRFVANNPGVWFMHCHLDRHLSWGMEMVFITRNGRRPNETLLPPPQDFPRC